MYRTSVYVVFRAIITAKTWLFSTFWRLMALMHTTFSTHSSQDLIRFVVFFGLRTSKVLQIVFYLLLARFLLAVLMGIFASRKSGNWKRYGLVVIYESLMVSSSSVSNSFGCRLWWSNEVIARINDCDCEEFGLSAHQIADSRTSSLLTFCAFIQVLIKYVAQHSLLNKKLRRQ